MTKRNKAAATIVNADASNAPPPSIEAVRADITAHLRSALLHRGKAESDTAAAAFTLADFIRKDGVVGMNNAEGVLTTSPDTFFSSEDARKPWFSDSVREAFMDTDDNLTSGTWRNTVDRAFSVLAFHNYLSNKSIVTNPDRKEGRPAEYLAINWERQEVPAMAFISGDENWQNLENNGRGKFAMVTFGAAREYCYGFDPSKKGAKRQVTVKFTPSLSAFVKNRAAWLNKAEVKRTRQTKAPATAATVTSTNDLPAVMDGINKAFNVTSEGNKPAPVKMTTEGAEATFNALHAILANLTVNNPDSLRGVLTDMVADDVAGDAFRAMLASVLAAHKREADAKAA